MAQHPRWTRFLGALGERVCTGGRRRQEEHLSADTMTLPGEDRNYCEDLEGLSYLKAINKETSFLGLL